MDLNSIKVAENSEEGADLIVLHPVTFEETDIVIKLAGMDSAKYRNQVKKIAERRMGKRQNNKIDLDAAERQSAEILGACTLKWKGVERDGIPVECTFANAVEIYADPNLRWLREQVDAFIAERSNFF